MSKVYILDEKKLWGVKKLLEWCVKEYQISTSVNGKRMWKRKIDFLVELQRTTHYTEEDKVIFNGIRKKYLQTFTK